MEHDRLAPCAISPFGKQVQEIEQQGKSLQGRLDAANQQIAALQQQLAQAQVQQPAPAPSTPTPEQIAQAAGEAFSAAFYAALSRNGCR